MLQCNKKIIQEPLKKLIKTLVDLKILRFRKFFNLMTKGENHENLEFIIMNNFFLVIFEMAVKYSFLGCKFSIFDLITTCYPLHN